MAENESGHVEEPKKFTPKNPPKLDPPKDDPISVEELAKCDGKITLWRMIMAYCSKSLICLHFMLLGTDSSYPTYVAIMGTVFDVSGNAAYSPKNPYNGT